MLQRTLLTVALVIASSTLWAQGTGIKLGATLPNWKYAADSAGTLNTNNLSNFTIAIVQEFPLGGVFSIQLEPTYSTRTTTTDILASVLAQYAPDSLPPQVPESLAFEHEITSIELPILLKIATGTSGIRGYIFAGPNIRFQLLAKTTLKTDTSNLNTSIPLEVKPALRTAVAAADIGAGIEIPLGLFSIVADGRYTFPLSDMSSMDAFGRRIGTLNSNDIRIFAGLMFRW
jgi:hypothetical protein